MTVTQRRHAIVMGASMAGLLAARVLAETYAQVTLLERDECSAHATARKGVPQSQQPHALLLRGKQILEELYPGLEAELHAQGALSGDMTHATRIVAGDTYLAKSHSGLPLLFATRPLIEAAVRTRTLTLPNVRLRAGTSVKGFVSVGDRAAVGGVRVRTADGAEEDLMGDLVVDATGRGSRTPAWLKELGFARPRESRLPVNVTYTSRFYRRSPEHLGGDLMLVTLPNQPKDRRVMGCFAAEGDRWHVFLTGWHGEHAPPNDAGVLEFARSLEHPDLAAFLSSLEPVSDYAVHRYPANVRHHYEELRRFPRGLIVIGDALCSFNPSSAQGMTVAALEALALRTALRGTRDLDAVRRRYFRLADRALTLPWSVVTGSDGSYPEANWPQPPASRVLGRYLNRVQQAAVYDGAVSRTFFQVGQMVRSPAALFAPTFVLRVLRARAPSRAPQASPPAVQPNL
ncbi:FAD-dependent oxidoreductase [Deinococcus hopiensis]|uniref:2-polyprenyl-6-methoxyphenol hydroxylase n=1 Tax=Deinococcus hopiensis KR-140 TaxID=695939 RepID=A0A1W1UPF6_9DEIO|nr:FAD-dependent monooxygenase [Deinococcus hopiensis]SMB82913.1 2-polyprenyl-6-methoxyphenol hydroxylase [Deinococcus hopiensis KR-140]